MRTAISSIGRRAVAGLVMGLLLCAPSGGTSGVKKLVYYGWSSPGTADVRSHWKELERLPFDGMTIVVAIDRAAWRRGQRGTANQLGWNVMSQRRFAIDEFREAIADLRMPRWQRFTDNFTPLILSAARGAAGLHWFDDKRWATVTNNVSVLAQIAAAGGFKGLVVDPEAYSYALFSYAEQRKLITGTFEDFATAARRRGRDLMGSIAAELRAPVILALFGYTLPLSERHTVDLAKGTYGLLPAFYDGLLEAMPPGGIFVDGYEYAYGFKERAQYLNGRDRIFRQAAFLSREPERYQMHVRAGFGVWLDYRKRTDYFTPLELARSIREALVVSDGYVWLYSEGVGIFPRSPAIEPFLEAIEELDSSASR